ncbi:hypothetical protein IV38_GL001570 [Lactobacillus selangorensis]|uniref:Low temperature requirement protein A n=1 Tax=Lactobacillus selangorensis TaxID=81857 RepID=A0A0R2FHQ6_9LACO|nr:low temperature requirement protein A [Lactobacillus selangorensis]KRN28120.1 hypothetical protein IV38_GL001570 [Lactobacillus selangorensis]KRN31003.1 hypothetical protein IV40_GL001645 [Lactobacillus selangorensis]
MNHFQKWWGTPQKLTSRVLNRQISWLELFSDLAYVVMLHSLIISYAPHYPTTGIWKFALFFMLVFYIWYNFMTYFDLHGDRNARTTVITLAQLVAVLALTTRFPLVFKGQLQGFIAIYLFVQILMLYVWMLVVHIDPDHLQSSWVYFVIEWADFFILIAALWVANPQLKLDLLIFVIFAKYCILPIDSPEMTAEMNRRHLPIVASESSEERFGQFAMILFGEAIALVTEPLMGQSSWHAILVFAVFMLNIILLWWLYYAFMNDVTVSAQHFLVIEAFHLLNVLFTLALAMMLLFMYLLLEEPTQPELLGYTVFMDLTVVLVFIMKDYEMRRFKTTTTIESILLMLVSLLAFKLPYLGMIGLLNLVLIGIIFMKERQQVLAQ